MSNLRKAFDGNDYATNVIEHLGTAVTAGLLVSGKYYNNKNTIYNKKIWQ